MDEETQSKESSSSGEELSSGTGLGNTIARSSTKHRKKKMLYIRVIIKNDPDLYVTKNFKHKR